MIRGAQAPYRASRPLLAESDLSRLWIPWPGDRHRVDLYLLP